ncbi:MAG: class I SAM-dependent methyltransferase [Anaerolineae bacterium]|nr:class I SAM-dependent methyltransferase [Anaerolineae bacterium]
MSTNGFNQQIADAFTEKMVDVLNYGSLALMTSIGHRTGLFDTMATLPPATIEQIAAAADLHERYVREWLGAMVVGRIIEHDPATNTYRLPTEHAAALTRAAAPNNIAAFTQYIGLLGSVEDGIVDSFRNGGGVPYAAFPRFQEVMAEDSGQSVLPALLGHILPLVPGLIEKLEQGIEVLDVGCGRGLALLLMAQTFPKSRFTGYDFSENGIAAARVDAQQKGLTNLRFAVQDAATLAETERYDLITTFDAIHDQAKPAVVLRNIHRALKTDGVYLMQDIAGSSHLHNNLDHPIGPFLYTVSTMHCMTVSLAYNGEGLGAMWGREKALEMLAEAGFTQVEVKELAHDIQNHYYINRKG